MERIYLDTSVFGGYFEPEFETWTKILFDRVMEGKFILLYSQLTDRELQLAPSHVKELLLQIPEEFIEIIDITAEAIALADTYIAQKVVGKTNRADCIHIALATLNHADVLTSWNFKHIVNLHRIRGYNSVNHRLGHQMIEIRTPREILEL